MADRGSALGVAGVYRRLVGARVRSDLQYRTSFFLFTLGQALVASFDFVAILVVFGRVESLAGWSRDEVLFLFGVSNLSFGVADMFVSQVELCARHIRAGTFDQFLLRPMSPFLQLSAQEFALRRVGRAVQPLIVLTLVLPRLDVDWSASHVALLAVTVPSGVAIFGAVWVITSSVAFWTVDTQEFANAFTYGGSYVTQYPIDIYQRWLRTFVVFVLPLAFTAYIPACVLLGKPLPFALPEAVAYATPLVAIVSATLASRVWRLAIRHHRSTGS